MKEHQLVRRSTAVLLFKIVLAELLAEIIYLSISALLSFSTLNSTTVNVDALRIATNLIMTMVAVGLFATIILNWVNEGITIDDEEIAHKRGVLKSSVSTYPYTNIQRVTVEQSVIGKLFNFGTINLYTPLLGQDLVFHEMPNPHELAAEIKQKLNKPDREQFLIRR